MRSVDILFLTSTSNHVQRSPAVQPNRTVAPTSSNEVASKYRPDWGQLRSVGATCVSTSRKQNAQHHFMQSITSASSPCQKKLFCKKTNYFTEGLIFRMTLIILKGWPWLTCHESYNKHRLHLGAVSRASGGCFQPNPPKTLGEGA